MDSGLRGPAPRPVRVPRVWSPPPPVRAAPFQVRPQDSVFRPRVVTERLPAVFHAFVQNKAISANQRGTRSLLLPSVPGAGPLRPLR